MANQRLNATITIGAALSATFSKTIGSIRSQLGSIGSTFGSLEQNQSRLGGAMRRNDAALAAARGGVMDAVGAFYALKGAIAAPVAAAAEFETKLEDIGQKADIPVEKLGELGDKIKKVARDTNQGAMQIGSAVDALVGRGAKVDVALIAADPIGKAATAYRAATDDLAAASWSAVDNLKVPADQIETALDAMAQAGKDGAFELRDMATYFPALGAAYQGLGQSGVSSVADLAAALQVVRKGTGDSSTAATNLQNVLQKIYAPGTVKKFGEAGVDVFAEMDAAAKRGLTPIEAIAELTNKTLKGDLSKMGTLFEDAQVQAGLRSLIQGMEEYRAIREKAMGAKGVVDADYERRIKTAQGVQDRFNASLQNLSITIGNALLPALGTLLDTIEPIIGKFAEFADAHPELVSNIMLAVGGMVAFKGALSAIRFVGLLGKGGALSLLSMGLNTVGVVGARLLGAASASIALQSSLAAMGGQSLSIVGKMAVGLKGMLFAIPGMQTMVGAIRAIGAALLANPIGLIIAGIAGAAYLIYRNWETVGPWFSKMWDSVKGFFSGFKDFVVGVFTLDMDLASAGLTKAWDGMKAYYSTLWDGIAGVFTYAWENAIKPVTDALGITEPIVTAWNAVKEGLGAVLDWMGAKFEWVLGKIAPVLNALKWVYSKGVEAVNGVSNAFGGEATGITSDPMGLGIPERAVGGSFGRGPVLVGERGPELRFENRAGFIATNRQMHSLSGMADRIRGAASSGADVMRQAVASIDVGGIVINAAPGMDPQAIADAVLRRIRDAQRGALYDGN